MVEGWGGSVASWRSSCLCQWEGRRGGYGKVKGGVLWGGRCCKESKDPHTFETHYLMPYANRTLATYYLERLLPTYLPTFLSMSDEVQC